MIRFFHKLKARRGFTLVELIVVIAIIGVLAAILIPILNGVIEGARKRGVENTCHDIHQMAANFKTAYMAQHGDEVTNITTDKCDMDIDGQGDMSFEEYVIYNFAEITKADTNVRWGVTWDWHNTNEPQVWYKEGKYKAEWIPGEGQKPAAKD